MLEKNGIKLYSKTEWEQRPKQKASNPSATEPQKQIIGARNCDLLVSAAAGSGKTWVLVERILSRLQEEHVEISQFLIVTFTNAAAAEMRERIGKALQKKCDALMVQAQSDSSETLQEEIAFFSRQITEVYQAKICTIDSFCGDLVKQYFMRVNVDPQYRIAEESELTVLKNEVMEQLLEDYYETAEDTFLHFVECYAPGRNDHKIESLILKLYHFQMSHPSPDYYMQESLNQLEESELWYRLLLDHCSRMVKDIIAQTQSVKEYAMGHGADDKLIAMFESDLTYFNQVLMACNTQSYKEVYAIIHAHGSYARINKKSLDADVGARVQELRNQYKKEMKDHVETAFFSIPYETLEMERSAVIPDMKVLLQLSKDFRERYESEKRERALADFSDVEHWALQILNDIDEEGNFVPSEVAHALKQQYCEIMIDEYQDSNMLQEQILSSFANQNMFMVGDMKQSIYRFRMACPELFVGKYKSYATYEENEKYPQVKIELDQNFRSSENVLASTNYLFAHVMKESIGNVEYDENAALKVGAEYPEPEMYDGEYDRTTEYFYDTDTELLIYDQAAGSSKIEIAEDAEEDTLDMIEQEARMVASKIHKLMSKDHHMLVKDTNLPGCAKEQYRPIEYRDIVILMRSRSTHAVTFMNVLNEAGIPTFVESTTGYFASSEIQVILNYLTVLNNTSDDVALVSVLKNYFGSVSMEELTRVILYCKKEQDLSVFEKIKLWLEYYQNLSEKEENDTILASKLQRFCEQLEYFRTCATECSVAELLQMIYEETGFYNYERGLASGDRKTANLNMLLQKASAYEKTNFRGLFQFVRYIEQLRTYEVDYGEANLLSENDNVVRIMSIHKSKGLEYPVVFVSCLSKQMNQMDLRDDILLHADYGVGPNLIDPYLRTKHKTIMRDMIALSQKKEMIGEELRVLYVAMTRAKDKLILTATCKELETYLSKIPLMVGYSNLLHAKCYLDFVFMSLVHHREIQVLCKEFGLELAKRDDHVVYPCKWQLEVFHQSEIELENIEQKDGRGKLFLRLEQQAQEHNNLETLQEQLAFVYPYQWAVERVGKFSVSQIKEHRMEQYLDQEELVEQDTIVEKIEPKPQNSIIPRFIMEQENAVLTGAQRGTLTHKFMELYDFSKGYDKEEYERVCVWMEQHQMSQIREVFRLQRLKCFFKSELAKEMSEAAKRNQLHKEAQFVVGFPADEILADMDVIIEKTKERLLIQGIVDAYYENADGNLIIMDYKTDHVKSLQELKGMYETQLFYYKKTLEQITGKQVIDCVLYSFHFQDTISCMIEE